jgi:hypothetical protein
MSAMADHERYVTFPETIFDVLRWNWLKKTMGMSLSIPSESHQTALCAYYAPFGASES